MRPVPRHDIQHRQPHQNRDDDSHQRRGLVSYLGREQRHGDDDDVLCRAKRNVEEGGGSRGEVADAAEDERAKGVGDLRAEVVGEGKGKEEVCLSLGEGLPRLGQLELGAAADAGLVGADALEGLEAFGRGEERSGGNVGGEAEADERDGEQSEDAGDEEEGLPLPRGWEWGEEEGEERGEDGGEAVGAVPGGDAEGLLAPAVPLAGDEGEEGEAAGFEEAEEEAVDDEAGEGAAGGGKGLGEAPAKDEAGHQGAVGDLDDEEGRDGLPDELGDGGDGADNGVLVAGEVRVLGEAKDGAVPEDGLVEDLRGSVEATRGVKKIT